MAQKAADLQVKQVQSERRQHLSSIATSAEEQQIFAGTAVQAEAAFKAAQQQLAQAEINLERTQVRSPVNGYVTNLLLRVGDFAHEGAANITVTDRDSYWIDGYFEETKMARVCVGDRVEAKLMGYAEPITGHVATVTRGIGVANAAAGAQGLPNVDPIFTWVRLAQRVPVRIAIDKMPPGVPLVAGMTATVTDVSADPGRRGGLEGLVARVRRCLPWSQGAGRLHSGDHDGAGADPVPSGGAGISGPIAGSDQSRPHARHARFAPIPLIADVMSAHKVETVPNKCAVRHAKSRPLHFSYFLNSCTHWTASHRCHPERSEGPFRASGKVPRCARDDRGIASGTYGHRH